MWGLFRTSQFVFTAALAWFVAATLGRIPSVVILLATIVATTNVTAMWMLRNHRRALGAACRWRIVNWYVGGVCWISGERHPLDGEPPGKFRLQTKRDFVAAGKRAKQVVRGHDGVIDGALTTLFECLTLRQSHRGATARGPLASLLLAGGEGVGKRYLARTVAKLLYGDSSVEVFDCRRITCAALLGGAGGEGALREIARRRPRCVFLFEEVDHASSEVADALVEIVTTGIADRGERSDSASLRDATIVLTVHHGVAEGAPSGNGGTTSPLLDLRTRAQLAEVTTIDPRLVAAVTAAYGCSAPSDIVQAEVVALLMKAECRNHEVELVHVDAEIIVSQVARLNGEKGFQLAPQRVKSLLRRPLVAVAERRLPLLSLRLRPQVAA